jgi:sarcosine oxidase, subunit alpha
MSKRLQHKSGEWINREKTISFSFEGKHYLGFEGDTISSALWANGEHVLGRSFKYHRPRGVLSFANHDVNIMMTDGYDTNIRADVVPIEEGMQLKVVNTIGGVKHDKNRWLDKISAILPVGFYYKAFFKPKQLFPFWEKIIRKSAGLGVVNFDYQHKVKTKTNQFTDVLVIGGGIAGMTAAIHAAQAGVKVVLVDENAKLGGSLNDDLAADASVTSKLEQLKDALNQYQNISCISNAYVAGYYADHYLPIITPNGMIRIRAKAIILATGAFEQPPVFRNNDLPAVMLSTAAQRLVNRYRVAPFNTGVVLTANNQGYRAALDLMNAGITITALVDLRQAPNEPLAEKVKAKGVQIYLGHCIYEAVAADHKLGVKAVIVCPYLKETAEADTTKAIKIECDGVIMSAGWSPAAALLYQAGTKMGYDDTLQQFVPKQLPKGVFAAGKVNGVFAQAQRELDGERAANEALNYLKMPNKTVSVTISHDEPPSHPYPVVSHPKGKNFIDFDEDIQLKDFINAAQEGFNNIELMKRFTTFGMGPSQGKHANMNAIRVLARIRQLPIDKVGSTTARPFYHPTSLANLAGHHYLPYRQTAMHEWHENAHAEFTQVGGWERPAYYKNEGLTKEACIQQEVMAVRKQTGLIDVSTLGKIEIHGKQAAEFLERVYTGSFTSQKIGKTRYGIIIDETGVVLDDGVVARLAEQHFYITTSTSNLALVYREMQRYQQMWQLDITLINVTSSYAAINLAGKSAQLIVSTLAKEQQTQVQTLKLGEIQELKLADIEVRLMSVGFVSKDAYEIHIPVKQAMTLWQEILTVGNAYQIQCIGTEAQRILRLEMGHALIGHDTDGLTNPFEAGLEHALKMDKPFFIGQRSLKIINKKQPNKKLVAFTLDKNFKGQQPLECNLVIENNEITGRVTSIAFSPTLQQMIGLAYVHPSQSAIDHLFNIRTDNGTLVAATVVNTPFIKQYEFDDVTQ